MIQLLNPCPDAVRVWSYPEAAMWGGLLLIPCGPTAVSGTEFVGERLDRPTIVMDLPEDPVGVGPAHLSVGKGLRRVTAVFAPAASGIVVVREALCLFQSTTVRKVLPAGLSSPGRNTLRVPRKATRDVIEIEAAEGDLKDLPVAAKATADRIARSLLGRWARGSRDLKQLISDIPSDVALVLRLLVPNDGELADMLEQSRAPASV